MNNASKDLKPRYTHADIPFSFTHWCALRWPRPFNIPWISPRPIQALIDRIRLDGDVTETALDDERMVRFREDPALRPLR